MDKRIKQVVDKLAPVLSKLARALRCPRCNKLTYGPYRNLGRAYHWFEGCADCAKAVKDTQ